MNAIVPVMKIRDILLVTMPSDPEDSTVTALQDNVLSAMERFSARGVIFDISSVETLDSYFVRTVSETTQMITLMGGGTIIVGMQPVVASTAIQMGLTLDKIETALSVDRAPDRYTAENAPRDLRRRPV